MPLFRGSAASLLSRCAQSTLLEVVTEQFVRQIGHRPSPAEARSWEKSLTVLANDLKDAGLDQVEVLVEYKLPLTSRRADVVLCGTDPTSGADAFVVVELKQWSRAWLLEDSTDLCSVDGAGDRLHPLAQVESYRDYIADLIVAAAAAKVSGVAYLHNADDPDVDSLRDRPRSEAELFTKSTRGAFLSYLRGKVSPTGGSQAADNLLTSPVRPSKQLLKLAAGEVQRREQFVLLDEQRAAFAMVQRAVTQARRLNTKEVIVVSGGPGSGKSVIALSLLGELSRQGRSVMHATGSSAFTRTLRKVAGARAPRVKKVFRYFNQFVDAEANELDVLICDEAHRIRATSANRYTPAKHRTDRPQVEELIAAARVPVFLLDQYQVVRPGELGTVADIQAAADRMGVGCRVVSLADQFRCGGSAVYEDWLYRLLELAPGGPDVWPGDPQFTVDTAARPEVLEDRLQRLMADGSSARMAAGYCWPWSDVSFGRLKVDVRIGEWGRPWNNKKDTTVDGAPGTPYWASDPAGFGQVGCVYTAQGFEYDYAGVIMGPDLVWRTDRWIARPEYSHDSQVKRGTFDQFDAAVRNTYKVLLTRGMRGVIVHSTDVETQELLDSVIGNDA